MRLSRNDQGALRVLVVVATAAIVPIAAARAQDTNKVRDVPLGFVNLMNTLPGVVVLPMPGGAGDSIRAILQRDLGYSDRMMVVKLDGNDASLATAPLNYALFERLGAALIVEGTLTAGGMRVTLHDVAKKASYGSFDATLPSAVSSPEWRLAVHGVSDDIEYSVFRARGIAQTRALYVRGETIRMVDSDGANDHEVVSSKSMSGIELPTSPSWNPNGREFVFTAMRGDAWQLFVFDLQTGKARQITSSRTGQIATPVYSPDGSWIAYAYTGAGGTDLYILPATGAGQPRRLTFTGSSNMYPSFSPDGRRIAFASNRTGSNEVYIMDADGSNVRTLGHCVGNSSLDCQGLDWSSGNLVAFHKRVDGAVQILTVDLRNQMATRTSDGQNQDPSWAPDGRHMILTSDRSGANQIWVYDNDSGNLRQLTHSGARLAAWSPPLRRTP